LAIEGYFANRFYRHETGPDEVSAGKILV
jgi:hypothetical protein